MMNSCVPVVAIDFLQEFDGIESSSSKKKSTPDILLSPHFHWSIRPHHYYFNFIFFLFASQVKYKSMQERNKECVCVCMDILDCACTSVSVLSWAVAAATMKHNELQKNCIPNNHIRNVFNRACMRGSDRERWARTKRAGKDEETGRKKKHKGKTVQHRKCIYRKYTRYAHICFGLKTMRFNSKKRDTKTSKERHTR